MNGILMTMDYDQRKERWYSPLEVLQAFETIHQEVGNLINDPVFKRAHEMFYGAVALVGAYGLCSENTYFMQANNQTRSPDIMAAKQRETDKGILLEMTPLEIVELEQHTETDNVVEFLKKTKLGRNKSYTDNDLILLVLKKNMKFNQLAAYQQLSTIHPKPTIYAIGKPSAEPGKWELWTLYPQDPPGSVSYVLAEAAKSYKLPPRMTLVRSLEKKIKYTNPRRINITAYEILGLQGRIKYIERKMGKKTTRA